MGSNNFGPSTRCRNWSSIWRWMSQAGGGAWTLDLGILSPVKNYPRELIGILGRGRMRLICKFGTTHKCRWGKRPVPWMSLPSALCPSFDRRGAIDVWNDTVWGRIWFGGKSCFESFGLSNERNNCGWMKKYSTNLKPGACKCSNKFGKRIWRGDGKLQFE